RISRLEKGMINIQEQVKIGFNHLSSKIRSLGSSKSKQKSIEHHQKSIKIDDLIDLSDEIDDYEVDTEQEEIEKISPVYENSFSEGEREYKDSKLQEKTQKQLVKKKRKEIRVNSINTLLCLHKLRL
ncbi:6111_t:CDS:1, partial [Funneliformis caledonium]